MMTITLHKVSFIKQMKGKNKMIILGRTPKDWRKEIGSKSLYYRTEIVIFSIGFTLGAIIF